MRKLLIAILILALLAAAGFVLTPPALVNEAQAPALPDDLDAYIAQREQSSAAEFSLVPGTEKRIRWHDSRQKTPYSIVNLHGFSGSRQGIAPLAERIVDTLVMISPNFAPIDPASRWITRPGGPLLLRTVVGETRSWQAQNAEQERYWSTSYPSAIIVEVMRLVDLANSKLPLRMDQSVLTLMSPNDEVVSPQATIEALQHVESPRKSIVRFDVVGDPNNHVLAGDILSPEDTDEVLARIVAFIRDSETAY